MLFCEAFKRGLNRLERKIVDRWQSRGDLNNEVCSGRSRKRAAARSCHRQQLNLNSRADRRVYSGSKGKFTLFKRFLFTVYVTMLHSPLPPPLAVFLYPTEIEKVNSLVSVPENQNLRILPVDLLSSLLKAVTRDFHIK